MQIPTIKTIVFFILFFLISSVLFVFIIINFYDQNSFLNLIENNLISYINKKEYKKPYTNYNYSIININKKISSGDFKNLLFYINEINPEYIFLDINFDRLKDTIYKKEIEEYIEDQKNIFGIIYLLNKKGIKFSKNKIDKELFENTLNIKTKQNFIYANYLDKLRLKNIFLINPEKIGFINNNYSIFNNNNIDILFKINNKYLLSAPFILFCEENNININQLQFEYTKIKYFNRIFYCDQKGRVSFIRKKIDRSNLIENINNFDEFENAFQSRQKIIDNLSSLKLFPSNSKGIKLYNDENKKINDVYNIQELDNKKQNELLTEAKDEALKWKSFKNVNQVKLRSKFIFIVQDDNYRWIPDFFYQKELLNNGLILKRIPLILIIISLIFIFLFLLVINYFTKNDFIQFFIIILLSLISLTFYFFLRIYFNIDFPFITTLLIIIYSYIAGVIIKKYNNSRWLKEVKSIYKGSISSQFAKKIAIFWKYKNWNLDSKQYLCSFLYIDKSAMLKADISEDDVEIIGAKNSEIESIIKNNNGIRNTFTPTEILCYFGNPPIYKNHLKNALNAVNEINNVQINLNNENLHLRQALHAKEEWFKFIKKGNQKYYTYFGNSINILSAMIQYAKLFDVTLIVSETIFKISKFKLPVRMLDRVKIEGIKGSIRLFELLSEDKFNENKKFYNYFHAGIKLYENKKWKEASAYFRQCLKIDKEDIPSKKYLDRCKNLLNSNIENWAPIYEIT